MTNIDTFTYYKNVKYHADVKCNNKITMFFFIFGYS